ncbi:MAG: hypothetical protein ACLPN1_12780 [Dissulfurispiraceae bacterium]
MKRNFLIIGVSASGYGKHVTASIHDIQFTIFHLLRRINSS